MNKLIASYLVLNVIFIILNAAMAGGGGLAATRLTASLSATVTTMSVDDTTGFLSSDVVTIDDEQIAYGSKTGASFGDLTRGFNGTTANTHSSGRYVYTQETSMINQALGYNVASTASTAGTFAIISLTLSFLGRSLLNIVVWNFPNIFGGEWIYLRIIFMAIGAGLVIYIGLSIIGPALGVVKRT